MIDWPTMSISALAFWAALALCGTGAVLAYALPGRRLGYTAAACACALAGVGALICGIGMLTGDAGPQASIPSTLPFGPLLIGPDTLGAFFMIIIGVLASPVAIFSIGYFAPDTIPGAPEGPRDLRPYGLLLCALLASLLLIVTAADAILFLIAWEAMACLSYLAATYHYRDRQVTRGTFLMLAVSEAATALVVVAFLFFYQASGTFAFAGIRMAGSELDPLLRSVLFVFVLVGFGAKAGILPFQFWLVEAHPAAPSPISALLSGVIIELAIYGEIRLGMDLLGPGPAWWGLVMMMVGTVTALIGVLQSLVQDNLKRLLAYSSVEHVGGIMLVGLGGALAFRSLGLPALAAIAALATLYHALNHAVFKGLLFLGAGAFDLATGTVRLERLGGLARRLPAVTATFIVGALAISAVPPFNGYVSEWMLLESLLQSFNAASIAARIIMTVSGALLALVAGIGITAFVRAVGVTCLGLPRSPEAEQARPIPFVMRLSLGWLAFLCLALGVTPTLVLSGADRVTTPLLGTSVVDQVIPPLFTGHPGAYAPLVGLGGGLFHGIIPGNGLVIIAAPNFSTIDSPSYLILAELGVLALIWLARRAIRPLGPTRTGAVWAGGIARFSPQMAYSGIAFSNPLRLMFNAIYRSHATVDLIEPAAHHRRGHIVYRQEIPPPFERILYRPARRFVHIVARGVKVVQSGNINQYLAYIFAIVLLILLLRLLP